MSRDVDSEGRPYGAPVLRSKAQAVPVKEITRPASSSSSTTCSRRWASTRASGWPLRRFTRVCESFVAGIRPADAPAGELDGDERHAPHHDHQPCSITTVGEEIDEGWEGCLSIPDVRGLVPRARTIRVDAHDRRGRRVQFTARGLPARVIQHETDHLDGVLFFDRMRSLGHADVHGRVPALLDQERRRASRSRDVVSEFSPSEVAVLTPYFTNVWTGRSSPHEPARDGQGRPVRALLAFPQVPPPPLSR